MVQNSSRHTHRFSIADKDAVRVLLNKIGTPHGSHSVDEKKLLKALAAAARKYSQSRPGVSQAFFHRLLTGYAVGLKHR